MSKLVKLLLLFLWTCPNLLAQVQTVPAELFSSIPILSLDLHGETRQLFADRKPESTYFPFLLKYSEQDSLIEIPLRIRTRGHFRLQKGNCRYPPLLLNFAKRNTPQYSLFAGQDKIKLVMPCQNEDWVMREYLIYKIYNLISDYSFQVRLVEVTFIEEQRDKIYGPFWGFIIEEDKAMAVRNQAKLFKRDHLRGNKLSRKEYLSMAVFQFMIGNTDWSTEYRHNIKLLVTEGKPLPIPVPYDFDHAGFVNASYAKPAEALQLRDVRTRRFRGFCLDSLNELDEVFDLFQDKRDEIITLIQDFQQLSEKDRKDTIEYIQSFYELIDDQDKRKQAFSYPCLPNGTGNVVIQGLPK